MRETTTDLDPFLGDHAYNALLADLDGDGLLDHYARSTERMTRFYALATIVVSLAMGIARAVDCEGCRPTAMLDASTTTPVTQGRG
jgi:hypothetical protein